MKVQLDQFNNSWYNPGSKIVIVIWLLFSFMFLRTAFPWPLLLKRFILRLFGAKIGREVMLKPNINIKYPWKLSIGNHVWIGENVWIDNLANVTIRNNVCISQGAFLLTGNHNYKKPTFDLEIGEINLADGVWIGAKSVVCPGISCAENSVLSVVSVATKNLESNTIYQGNPAVAKRKRV
jgi:putative colanic acid biosynthesis acetyltransferase WcaF